MTARRLPRVLAIGTGILIALAALLLMASCGDNEEEAPAATNTPAAAPTEMPTETAFTCAPAGSATSLSGAGATFPYPLYSKWIDEYQSICGVTIDYQSIGSGGGIKAITDQTVDFGASDAILNDEQRAGTTAAGGDILMIPMTMGGIAVVANLPDLTQGQLKLTPDVLAKIYLKQITNWSDPAIADLNSGLTLPDTDIAVVHRSDGSGTTFQFTSYLAAISPDWESQVGAAASVDWPGDVGGEGNEGVANQVNQLPGAIGYVEVAYAVQNNMTWASLQNSSGTYEEPTLEGISAAASGVTLPDNMEILLVNSSNPDAYPIAGFTWILAYVNQTDQAKASTLANYLWWSIHDGQEFSEALNYAKMPDDAVTKAEALIEQILYNGSPVLQMP